MMPLEKKPFTSYELAEDKPDCKFKIVNIKFNLDEIETLKDAGLRLGQAKKSTIIKMLIEVGYAEVKAHEKLIGSVMTSYRRNKRLGIGDIATEIRRNFDKSI